MHSVPFFELVQLLVEACAVLSSGITSVVVPGTVSLQLSDFGSKLEAIPGLIHSGLGAHPTVIWCQSPVLAALVARAIATTTDFVVVDAASPNLELASRALIEFNEGTPRTAAIVLSLNAEDGSVLNAPIFPARVREVDQVIFVHPIVGDDADDALKLVRRAIRILRLQDAAYRWLVAKDTVEEKLMQPIMAKYGFGKDE
ncbi:hypothetical protein H9P43_008301 [Blastocladiella emersonii ATCC 22665]|nr:hypothetical protein H9P43_008301 [Blastocladiella emersonii ATCC 22665]